MFSSPGYLPILGVKPRFQALQVHSLPAELPGKLPVDSLKCWEFLRIPQVYIFTFLSKVICFQILFWSKIHNEYFSIFFFPPLLCSCFAWLSPISFLGKIIQLLCVLYLNVFRRFEATYVSKDARSVHYHPVPCPCLLVQGREVTLFQ